MISWSTGGNCWETHAINIEMNKNEQDEENREHKI